MKRKEFWILAVLAVVILAFFWDLATLKHAFLSGDHREQQYPWAKFYQEQIRSFHLPWWTGDIHCGFPILAEGQIGAFYPLNYLFFLLLPVKIAYNYIVLFQYWLGAALFYGFLRRLKLSPFASFFSTLIYLFGSTQGGYFYYNYISQKTVIWLPLTLILIDRLAENKKWPDAFWLGAVFAVQIFAGYLQVAVYSMLYSFIYFLYRWWNGKNTRFFWLFAAGCGLGIFFSLVQLAPTYELSLLSSRAAAEKGLAYVGSMTPAGFITLFYPAWDAFTASEFYVGLAGLFFVFTALLHLKSRDEKFFLGAVVLFLLLALGKYSPLYRLIIETTGFNSFRTPIKFLFFVTFSAAVLAGYGADRFFTGRAAAGKVRAACVLFMVCASFFLAVPKFGPDLLKSRRTEWLPKFQKLIVETFHGKAGHPYPADYYEKKAESYYDGLTGGISLSDQDTKTEFYFLLIMLLAAGFIWVRPRPSWFLKGFLLLFLTADLYAYGFTSIKPNEEPFDTIDTAVKSPVTGMLLKDKSLYRVMEVYRLPQENRLFPVFPSFNMLDHIQDIGAYSPLVMRKYKDFVDGWAYINDSLSVHWVDPKKVAENLPSLSFLNVKYLLSAVPLQHPSLESVFQDGKVAVYRNRNVMPRAFFVPGGFSSFQELLNSKIIPVEILKYSDQEIRLAVQAPAAGSLIVSDVHYPGWEASVDGDDTKIAPVAGLFKSVWLQPGRHDVRMVYNPIIFDTMGVLAALGFLFGLFEMAAARKAER